MNKNDEEFLQLNENKIDEETKINNTDNQKFKKKTYDTLKDIIIAVVTNLNIYISDLVILLNDKKKLIKISIETLNLKKK